MRKGLLALGVLFLAGAASAADYIIRPPGGGGGGGSCDLKYCEPGGGGGGQDPKSCFAAGKVYLYNLEGGVWVCVSRATLSTPATHGDANGVYPLLGEKRKQLQAMK